MSALLPVPTRLRQRPPLSPPPLFWFTQPPQHTHQVPTLSLRLSRPLPRPTTSFSAHSPPQRPLSQPQLTLLLHQQRPPRPHHQPPPLLQAPLPAQAALSETPATNGP